MSFFQFSESMDSKFQTDWEATSRSSKTFSLKKSKQSVTNAFDQVRTKLRSDLKESCLKLLYKYIKQLLDFFFGWH